jgi:hypothetical protein
VSDWKSAVRRTESSGEADDRRCDLRTGVQILAEFAIFQVALQAKNLFFRGQPAAFSAGASSWRLLR